MIQLLDVISKKKAIVQFFLKKNILITTDILNKLHDTTIVENLYDAITANKLDVTPPESISSFFIQPKQQTQTPAVKVVFDYQDKQNKKSITDFVGLFNARFKTLEKMLQSRQELQNLSSINRLSHTREGGVSIIGMVSDKQFTKNENIILTIEDETGFIKTIITKSKQDLYPLAKDVVLDEVIGLTGALGENIIFANNIIFPDIPLINELKKAPDDVCAIVLSDLHIGSQNFLHEEFNHFITWIRGETGDEEQKSLAQKVKYIFIVGDMVDGVGIYPSQEKELTVKDVYQQYNHFSEFIKKIPSDIAIIISTGNHDAVRVAEPQPKLRKELCPDIWHFPNLTFLGNPAVVTIHASQDFPGFDVLLYHGYSYDYYGGVVESIRLSGRHISDRNDLIMKFLLQRRHLAPTYGSTPYIPDATQDPLIIEKIPDFFFSGHVHRAAINSYRGVQIVSGSCWQSKTAFQEKVGHEPEPCRVPIIDLKTRVIKMLRFDISQENKEAS